MARRPRQVSPTGVYHFINRGVNKKKIFHNERDFEHYRKLLKEYTNKLDIKIFHYCFMSNHTHMLLRVPDVSSLSKFGHFVQRRYAYYYCKTYHWSEQVFRKRFLSPIVTEDEYLLECGRYIERNPLDSKLVHDIKDYPYTSYLFYAYNKTDDLLTESPLYKTIGRTRDERMVAYRFYVMQNRQKEQESLTPFQRVPFMRFGTGSGIGIVSLK